MYFTIAELELLVLRRQLDRAREKFEWARDRDWTNAMKGWQSEIRRLIVRVAAQELRVKADLARRSDAKAKWLERLV